MAVIELREQDTEYNIREAYKALRTNLRFCGPEKKVIAVTSCTPDEGKSTVTLNLAMTLSETGARVLVVDADLRKSVMIGNFRLKDKLKGLTHYLTNQATLQDVVCSVDKKKVDVIFAGPIPPNPSELLGGESFKRLIRKMKGEYDYVLIDTPPVGSVIDAVIVSEICDGAIMVIAKDQVSRRFIQNAKEQLEKSGCTILGAVLNKVEFSKRGSYGKYYGQYYGNYASNS